MHSRIVLSQVAAAGGILLLDQRHQSYDQYVWYMGGLLAGILLSPDLDVDSGYVGNFYMRRLGVLPGTAWRALWWPYSRMFAHRGISHWCGIGTATRVGYVYLWWGLLHLFGVPLWWPPWEFLFGLVVADCGHVLADGAK